MQLHAVLAAVRCGGASGRNGCGKGTTMRINSETEAWVRQTLDAAVKRDGERFAGALESMPSESAARDTLQLAATLSTFMLRSEYGGRPTDDMVRRIATAAAEAGEWFGLTADDYCQLLGPEGLSLRIGAIVNTCG